MLYINFPLGDEINMDLEFKLRSLYICVKNMERAIEFYENLLGQKVDGRNDIYSVFDINGFRYGLFANEKMNEAKNGEIIVSQV